jgi:hypothetical protein
MRITCVFLSFRVSAFFSLLLCLLSHVNQSILSSSSEIHSPEANKKIGALQVPCSAPSVNALN